MATGSKNPKIVFNDSSRKSQSHVSVSDQEIIEESEEDTNTGDNEFILVKLVRNAIHFFFDFLETIVVALSVFVVIYLFIIQPHEVKGSSMEPSFSNNQYIITDKLSYRFGEPKRGDVVIFKAPTNPEVDYIKRIIGLPGESVKILDGKVYVNEQILNEGYLEDITLLFPRGFLEDGQAITVPANHYFVMGDNRPHSSDSREFGPIDRKLIVGKAVFRYWPVNNLGLIPAVSYRF